MEWIKRIFRRKQSTPDAAGRAEKSLAQAEHMLQMIQDTQEIELACDEVLNLLGEYAEMARRGEDVAALLPQVAAHLGRCPDCREEYEALIRILEVQQ